MQTQWSTGANDGLGGAPAGGGSGAPAPAVAPRDRARRTRCPSTTHRARRTPTAAVDAVDGLLDEVELALARLDDGTYGRCEECGTPIDDARLAVSPTVRTCGTCVIGGGDPTAVPARRGIRRSHCPGGRRRPHGSDRPAGLRLLLRSQNMASISAIWLSRRSATATSFVFLVSPAVLVAFQNRSWRFGNFSRCSGLK